MMRWSDRFPEVNSDNTGSSRDIGLPLAVIYDSGCALCKREIQHYMRLDKHSDVNWMSIVSEGAYLDRHGITADQAMRVLHVVENESQIYTGVDAFLKIWSRLGPYQILGFLVSIKPLYNVTCYLYGHFARWRFDKRCSGRSSCRTQ